MRARAVAAAAAVAVVSIAACTGAPASPPATPAPPAPFVVATEPAPAIDLSELEPPKDLAFTARLARVDAVARLLSLLPVPGPTTLDDLVGIVVGAPVGPVADADAPIDFVAADGPGDDIKVAFSVQLRDPGHVLDGFEPHFDLVPLQNGARRLRPKTPPASDPTTVCLLAPVPGTEAPRLVCAPNEKDLTHLAPYLTRTVTRIALSSDLRMELLLAPLAVGLGAASDDGASDAVDRLGTELGAGLMRDIRSVVLEGNLDGHDIVATLTARFGSSTCPLTPALLSQAAPPGPPPPAFFRLPADALLAFHAQGATPSDLAPLRAALGGGLRRSFLDDGHPADELEPFMRVIEQLVLTGGPIVWAAGVDLNGARTALSAYLQAGKHTEAARAKARLALQGWVLVGVEEPSARWIDGIRTFMKLDDKGHKHPPGKGRAGTNIKIPRDQSTLRVTPLPPGLGLPAGTLHIEDRNTPNPAWVKANPDASPPIARTNHAFVVPDGGRTWLAVGVDPKLAASKVRAALAGAPAAGTIGVRREAELFRHEATSAGFLPTLAGVTVPALPDTSHDDLTHAHDLLEALAATAGKGTEIVPVLISTRREGQGGAASVRVRLPMATLVEAGNVISRYF